MVARTAGTKCHGDGFYIHFLLPKLTRGGLLRIMTGKDPGPGLSLWNIHVVGLSLALGKKCRFESGMA